MDTAGSSITQTLQQVRKARRLSQLELSMRLGISQRHVSFVENGRSRPSRELLQQWLRELHAPLVLRNAVLLQAGYAPESDTLALDASAIEQAIGVLTHLIRAQDPTPAMIVGAQWELLDLNGAAHWLAVTLLPWTAELLASGTPANLLDLLLHPQGLTNCILNLGEVGPAYLMQLREELTIQPVLASKVQQFEALLHERLGSRALQVHCSKRPAAMPTIRFSTCYGELAFISMFTTFGSPQNITTVSLRVEHMFPADVATRQVLEARQAGRAASQIDC